MPISPAPKIPTPFSPERCVHRRHLRVLGRRIVLATDSLRVHRILGDAFESRFFERTGGDAELIYYCSLDSSPWRLALGFPDDIFVGSSGTSRETFDLFRWSRGKTEPCGTFSFENSTDLTTVPSEPEMFAAYFQRRVLGNLLKRESSIRMVHGGALAHGEKGLLILAPSRGGKSTLTLACVLSGMRFLSDDHVPLDMHNKTMHPFPRMLRLREGTCRMIPEFASLCTATEIDPAGETRYFLHPETIRKDALGSPVRLTHIVRLTGFADRPRIVPAPPAEIAVGCADADFFASTDGKIDLIWQWGPVADAMVCADLEVGHPLETVETLRNFLET